MSKIFLPGQSPVPDDAFGSIEEAMRELEGLLIPDTNNICITTGKQNCFNCQLKRLLFPSKLFECLGKENVGEKIELEFSKHFVCPGWKKG